MYIRIIAIIFISSFLFNSCKSGANIFKSNNISGTEENVSTNSNEDKTKTSPTKINVSSNETYAEDVSIYIQNYNEIAKEEMDLYGIPASILLAQGILESGAGKSELFLKSNNHFGLKCNNRWKGDVVYHHHNDLLECFRKYNDPDKSYRDQSLFLSSQARYEDLFELKEDDYKGWANGMKNNGYAIDFNFPKKIIDIIEKHELYIYDDDVLKRKFLRTKNDEQPKKVTYIVEKGDTLSAISRKYDITISSIKELNGLKSDKIYIGQELQIFNNSPQK